jgi:uncharacterized protein
MPDSNVSLATLRTLHRLHRQLTDLSERQQRGPKQIRATEANIKHCEEGLARLRDEVKAMRMAADQKQLQLKTNEEKIKDHKRKLNAATNNREYQLLKDQIAADDMAKSVLEDETIEILDKIDQFKPKTAEAEAAVAAAKQKAQEVRAAVDKEQPTIQADIQRLDAELKTCEAMLPPLVREMYQRVVRQKGEDALAEVEDGFCAGCHQQVPLNVQAEIRLLHPMFCRTCGRLLYIPEDATPARAPEE